jgi:hypothetical protein
VSCTSALVSSVFLLILALVWLSLEWMNLHNVFFFDRDVFEHFAALGVDYASQSDVLTADIPDMVVTATSVI